MLFWGSAAQAPKGFEDRDVVALSGAHTVGSCHGDRSGFEGPWTDDKLLFDNSYFKDLLQKPWAKETNRHGKTQYRSGGTMMLTTDMALPGPGLSILVHFWPLFVPLHNPYKATKTPNPEP